MVELSYEVYYAVWTPVKSEVTAHVSRRRRIITLHDTYEGETHHLLAYTIYEVYTKWTIFEYCYCCVLL